MITSGTYADLLVMDCNLLAGITLLADSEMNLNLIVKGGKIYKNILKQTNQKGKLAMKTDESARIFVINWQKN